MGRDGIEHLASKSESLVLEYESFLNIFNGKYMCIPEYIYIPTISLSIITFMVVSNIHYNFICQLTKK